jgi:hypothetical protein
MTALEHGSRSVVGVRTPAAVALAAIVFVVALALAGWWFFSPRARPRVVANTQLTSDTIPKSRVVTDGTRLYITEWKGWKRSPRASRRGRRGLSNPNSVYQCCHLRYFARQFPSPGKAVPRDPVGTTVLGTTSSLRFGPTPNRRYRARSHLVT